VLQEFEIRVLEQMFLYCSNKGLIENGVCVLCADGLMIERRFYNENLLTKFAEIIRETIGFNLVFTQKEMNKGYLAVLNSNLCFDLYNPHFTTGFMAEHFSVMYSNKFLCVRGGVCHYNGVFWESLDKKNSKLNFFVDDKFYEYMVGYCSVQLNIKNVLLISATTDEDKKRIEDDIGKIGYLLNNVQGLRKNKFRKEFVYDIIDQITNNSVIFDLDPNLFAFNNKI
jgi:hypothetical protein